MPKVLNFRSPEAQKGLREGTAIYIGRPRASEGKGFRHFGNPFSHLDGTLASCRVASREEAVRSFELWLKGEIQVLGMEAQRTWILAHLHQLAGKDLACWCAPSRCHGEVLLSMANKKGEE